MPSLISVRFRNRRNHRIGVGFTRPQRARRFALIALGGLACWAPLAALAASPPVEDPVPRIESLIRNWYSLLEQQSVESCSLEEILAEAPFEFALVEGSAPGPAELSAWVSELRSSHPQVEYQLAAMRTRVLGDGTYRIRFAVDRTALDAAGMSHVARREQTWLVRDRSGAPALVLRIDDERQIVFPGTGPQIVCY